MQPVSKPKTVPPNAQVIHTSIGDRWFIRQRLQELEISCGTLVNGLLWVDVQDDMSLMMVWSVVQQYTALRWELVEWLEKCWNADERR